MKQRLNLQRSRFWYQLNAVDYGKFASPRIIQLVLVLGVGLDSRSSTHYGAVPDVYSFTIPEG